MRERQRDRRLGRAGHRPRTRSSSRSTTTAPGAAVGRRGPVMLVDGIAGLSDWLAAPGAGGNIILAWKAGGTVFVAGRTAAGGAVFAAGHGLHRHGRRARPRHRRHGDAGGPAGGRTTAARTCSSGDAVLVLRGLAAAPTSRRPDGSRSPDPGVAVARGHRRAGRRGRGRVTSAPCSPARAGPASRCSATARSSRPTGPHPSSRTTRSPALPPRPRRRRCSWERAPARGWPGVRRSSVLASASPRMATACGCGPAGVKAAPAPQWPATGGRRLCRVRRPALCRVRPRASTAPRPSARRHRAPVETGGPACGSTPSPPTGPATSTSPSRLLAHGGWRR